MGKPDGNERRQDGAGKLDLAEPTTDRQMGKAGTHEGDR
jgi:hypothetical protein